MAPQIPEQIQFQLRDVAQGLTYSASTAEYIFADDPMPAGADNGQVTLVVDMSENGDQPISVQSLSSSLMVSDIRWTSSELPEQSAPILTVNSIVHERTGVEHQEEQSDKVASQQLFAAIQRDARNLSKRVALVKKALGNLEPAT